MKVGIIGGSGFYGTLPLFDGKPKVSRDYVARSLKDAGESQLGLFAGAFRPRAAL